MEKYLVPDQVGEGDITEQWQRFKKEFALFLTALGKDKADSAVKLAMFLRVVGPRINDMYEALTFAEGEDKGFEGVMTKLDSLCARRTSKHVLRDKFFQLKQAGRTVDQFVSELRRQVKDCDFGNLKEDLMLHVLIRGIDSERMRRRLFETEKLDLAKAIQMCQTIEATTADLQSWEAKELSEQVAAVKDEHREEDEVAMVRNRGVPVKGKESRSEGVELDRREREEQECWKCGRCHRPRQCPAFGQRCLKCNGLNHFARRCKLRCRPTQLVQELETEELLQIKVEKKGKKLLASFWCQTSGKSIELTFQLDTAASCNVMSFQDYVRLGRPKLQDSRTLLSMYDGSVKRSLGLCVVVVKDKEGKSKQLGFEVLKTRHHTLISLDTCLQLELLSYRVEKVNLVAEHSPLTKEKVLMEFGDVFSGVGCLPGEYQIDLDPAVPPMLNRPRKIPHTMRAAVEDKLRVLEENGIIAAVEQPTEWISNITTVWKPEKKSVRVCLDPRDLNKAIRRNHFHLPTLDDVLPRLKGARVFSLLDAKDGFLQVKLSESSSFLTTFWGAGRKYRWLRMPFGISSAPEEFQRRLQGVLHGLEGVAVVADDTLVFGVGETEAMARRDHDQKLFKLLQRAREVNLKFNKDKMRLHQTELLYIGHQISAEGVKPDVAKVKAVKGMRSSHNKQMVAHSS